MSDGPPSSSDQQNEMAPFKLEATVPSRLALGARCGYSQRCWGSPVRQKKKHTGTHLHTGNNVCVFIDLASRAWEKTQTLKFSLHFLVHRFNVFTTLDRQL